MLENGERQVAPTVEQIRADHVARYRWAARTLKPRSHVLDLACGCGYGAHILAEAGHRVVAMDREAEAIAYAEQHYAHPNITYRVADAQDGGALPLVDAVVCFETLEHLEHPGILLNRFRGVAPVLLASVPNEEKFPFRGYKFHHRHYTAEEFDLSLIHI